MVYVMVYVPDKLEEGIITPVPATIDNPAGLDVNVPPVVPVIIGD